MLKRGDAGAEVRQLQSFLNAQAAHDDAGAVLAVDGDFGDKTEQALQTFQRAQRLEPDGVFGPATKAAAQTLGFAAPTRIEGVDVSYYSTDGHGKSLIDWLQLDPLPKFFWARASNGLSRDATFPLHVADGAATGAVPGAYHFFVATDDPAAQARTFFSSAKAQPARQTLRPVIDIESNRATPLSDDEARAWAMSARALIVQVENLFSRSVVVYTNPKTAHELGAYLDAGFWGARLLWLAEYTTGGPTVPAPWTSCAAHQFAGDVQMHGARCLMDRNVIYSRAAFDLLNS